MSSTLSLQIPTTGDDGVSSDDELPPPYAAKSENWKIPSSEKFYRIHYSDPSHMSPWGGLQHLRWCERTKNATYVCQDHTCIAYDFDSKALSRVPYKYGIWRGKRDGDNPDIIYRPLRGSFVDANKTWKVKVSWKRDKKAKQDRLEIKYGKLNMQWSTSQMMSTVNGNTYDTTTYKLTGSKGEQIASFAWLDEKNNLDTRIRVISAELPMETIILTLSVLIVYQWGAMQEELEHEKMEKRIPSLLAVREQLTNGRKKTYCVYDETIDQQIQSVRDVCEGRTQRSSGRPNAQPPGYFSC